MTGTPKLVQLPEVKQEIDTIKNNITNIQNKTAFDRTVTLKSGVTANVGQLLAYSTDGYILADNTALNSMLDIVLVSSISNNIVKVIDIGTIPTSLANGFYYVGTTGNPTSTQPTASNTYVENIGHVENGLFVFRPSIPIKLV